MRLRHKKWTDKVLNDNLDIANNLEQIQIEKLKKCNQLEIGCGQGFFLLSMAKNNPNDKFLGVEINRNAYAMAVKHASTIKKETNNFYIVNSPIEKLFELFELEQFNNIFINFPDPWPRKRENKRRLTYIDKLNIYYKYLKSNGSIYFRSDNTILFEDSINYFKDSKLYKIKIISPYINENDDFLSTTEYETKFISKGIKINLLIAKKK